MKLRSKILLIVIIGFCALIALVFTAARVLVDQAFSELEAGSMHSGAKGALTLYQNELDRVGALTREWAGKAEIGEIAAGIAPERLNSEEFNSVFIEMGWNLVALIDNNGKIVAINYYDLTTKQAAPVPDSIRDFLYADSFLRVHRHARSKISGIVNLADGTMIMASLPIRPAGDGELVRGAIITGRWWRHANFARVLEASGYAVYDQPLLKTGLPPDFQVAAGKITHNNRICVLPLSQSAMAGYVLLDNVYSDPALILRIARPRYGYMRAFRASALTAIWALAAGTVIIIVILVLLELFVLRRLRILVREVSEIESMDHISGVHITVRGQDEVGKLSEGLRYVLSALRVNRFRWIRTEKQLQKLLAASPAGIIFVDQASGKVRRTNEAAAALLGISASEILDRNLNDLLHSIGGNGELQQALHTFSNEQNAVPALFKHGNGQLLKVLLNGRDIRVDRERSLLLCFTPMRDISMTAEG